jgi:hypothetical protein
MAFEWCFERLLDLIIFRLCVIWMYSIVGGASPKRKFTGSPGWFVFWMRDRQEIRRRLEFGEVGVDGIEVEMHPSEGWLVHDIGADEEIFRMFNSAFDEGGYRVVFEEKLDWKRVLG